MTGENCSVKNVKIAYVGGGSHAWAWVFMNDLAKETVLSGTVRLYDIDAEAAENNRKIGTRLFEREDVKGNFKFETSASLREALTGADFVVISILPGTFDEMESDVHLPERCGIYQSVGDTAGPGGLVRALRTIPMYVEIAEAVKQFCPQAWCFGILCGWRREKPISSGMRSWWMWWESTTSPGSQGPPTRAWICSLCTTDLSISISRRDTMIRTETG